MGPAESNIIRVTSTAEVMLIRKELSGKIDNSFT